MNLSRTTGGRARTLRTVLVLVLTVCLAGCAGLVRSEYQRPALSVPDQWQTRPETGTQILAADQWWQVFQDETLNRLIAQALKRNNDLAAATLKVRQARLQAGLAATNRTPDFSVGAGTGIQKDLEGGERTDNATATASLSWELDLWGKLAASRDAAQWEAGATEQDRANTALSLIGITAGLYWQIAYLNQAMATGREGIAYAQKTLDLVRVKYRAGAVSNLDVLQAELTLESQKADLTDLERQMAEARNALAILFDQAPEHDMADPRRLSELPLPVLQAGIPAAVLSNRPDLRAAEMRLRSTLADADVTRAGYYPDLSLTSSLGTSSTQLLDFLRNPLSTLGAGLTLPFVQWRQARLNTRISELAYEQAVVEFRQTLYAALKDVENALSARQYYLTQETALRRSAELARKAEQVAEIRYRQGQTGVQVWLDQQESRRIADLALTQNRYNQLKNMMTLYQALGGGAETADVGTP